MTKAASQGTVARRVAVARIGKIIFNVDLDNHSDIWHLAADGYVIISELGRNLLDKMGLNAFLKEYSEELS
jgi:hypothetical protein